MPGQYNNIQELLKGLEALDKNQIEGLINLLNQKLKPYKYNEKPIIRSGVSNFTVKGFFGNIKTPTVKQKLTVRPRIPKLLPTPIKPPKFVPRLPGEPVKPPEFAPRPPGEPVKPQPTPEPLPKPKPQPKPIEPVKPQPKPIEPVKSQPTPKPKPRPKPSELVEPQPTPKLRPKPIELAKLVPSLPGEPPIKQTKRAPKPPSKPVKKQTKRVPRSPSKPVTKPLLGSNYITRKLTPYLMIMP